MKILLVLLKEFLVIKYEVFAFNSKSENSLVTQQSIFLTEAPAYMHDEVNPDLVPNLQLG